jgi:hypothetical protein
MMPTPRGDCRSRSVFRTDSARGMFSVFVKCSQQDGAAETSVAT